jgi:small neutral amino acid transporter SnatA (MarC family)
LIDIFRGNSLPTVASIVIRAALISGIVFGVFAYTGEAVFTQVLQVRFAAFQVFGGLLFLLVALRFMLSGSATLVTLRGEPGQIAGAVAMPFMIGPGTVSAATMAALRLPLLAAAAAILLGVAGTATSCSSSRSCLTGSVRATRRSPNGMCNSPAGSAPWPWERSPSR